MAKYKFIQKKSRHINEEGEQPVAAPQPAATAAPTAQPAPAPAPPTNTTQPAQTTQAAQPAQATAATQPQQPVQQQQPQQDPKAAEKATKVAECINHISGIIQKNDPYALLALNVPDTMMAMIPGFKEDQSEPAKSAKTKWEEFKKSPNAESFKSFTDAVNTYGNGTQPAAQPQQPQQPAPQQPAQTPAPEANAVNAQAESEYRSFTFGQRLNENLQKRMELSNAAKSYQNYRPFGDF